MGKGRRKSSGEFFQAAANDPETVAVHKVPFSRGPSWLYVTPASHRTGLTSSLGRVQNETHLTNAIRMPAAEGEGEKKKIIISVFIIIIIPSSSTEENPNEKYFAVFLCPVGSHLGEVRRCSPTLEGLARSRKTQGCSKNFQAAAAEAGGGRGSHPCLSSPTPFLPSCKPHHGNTVSCQWARVESIFSYSFPSEISPHLDFHPKIFQPLQPRVQGRCYCNSDDIQALRVPKVKKQHKIKPCNSGQPLFQCSSTPTTGKSEIKRMLQVFFPTSAAAPVSRIHPGDQFRPGRRVWHPLSLPCPSTSRHETVLLERTGARCTKPGTARAVPSVPRSAPSPTAQMKGSCCMCVCVCEGFVNLSRDQEISCAF